MLVEALGRQMAVCSFDGVIRLTRADQRYWNVVSIYGPQQQRADLPWAKSVHYSCFDDVEEEGSTLFRSPRATDIADIFGFIDRLGAGLPSPPLLIHCAQGISRSAAIALSWIYGHLPASADRLVQAVDAVLELRPQAKPNRLVLTFGLAQFMPTPEARDLTEYMLKDPRLVRNRFQYSGE